jgi:hypothetical protein
VGIELYAQKDSLVKQYLESRKNSTSSSVQGALLNEANVDTIVDSTLLMFESLFAYSELKFKCNKAETSAISYAEKVLDLLTKGEKSSGKITEDLDALIDMTDSLGKELNIPSSSALPSGLQAQPTKTDLKQLVKHGCDFKEPLRRLVRFQKKGEFKELKLENNGGKNICPGVDVLSATAQKETAKVFNFIVDDTIKYTKPKPEPITEEEYSDIMATDEFNDTLVFAV